MAVTLVKDLVGWYIAPPDGGGAPTNFDVIVNHAVTVGNKIIVWGHTAGGSGSAVTVITDDRGNVYTLHVDGSAGIFLASAPCTTALAVNDKIHVFRKSTASTNIAAAVVMAWSNVGQFTNAASGTFSSTSMVGGVATAEYGELVLGLFRTYISYLGNGHVEIATPGSGFSNLAGAHFDVNHVLDLGSVGLDHEYRASATYGSIQATATGTQTPTSGVGLTAVFKQIGLPPEEIPDPPPEYVPELPPPEPANPDEFGNTLYEGLEPVAEDDSKHDYALRTFARALGQPFGEIENYVRDQNGDPGWSVAMDVDRIPYSGLAWLAQFAGVVLVPGLSDTTARHQVRERRQAHRGTPAAIVKAAQTHLTGDKRVTLVERDGSPYQFTVNVESDDAPATDVAGTTFIVRDDIIAAKPAGLQFGLVFV